MLLAVDFSSPTVAASHTPEKTREGHKGQSILATVELRHYYTVIFIYCVNFASIMCSEILCVWNTEELNLLASRWDKLQRSGFQGWQEALKLLDLCKQGGGGQIGFLGHREVIKQQ